LEPAATALNQYSEQLDNAYWTGSAVVTANTTISPDGYQSADTLNDNTTAFLDKRRAITITANATHTFSFFVKKTTGSLTHYAGLAALLSGVVTRVDYGIINTTTGAINRDASSNINSVSYSSVSYGDYWRVVMTFTDNQLNTTCTIIAYPAISTNGTSINQNAQGSNVFWGLNFTQSTYATSYIPTLGASVTRVADGCNKTSATAIIGQTEGTLFAEVDFTDTNADQMYLTLSDGTTNNRMHIGYDNGANRLYFNVRVSGVQQALIVQNTPANGIKKIAAAYKANDVVLYINGVQIGSSTSTSVATTSRIDVGNYFTTGFEYPVKQALLFKTRLSNSDLATLTQL
jgi:hypothetical protein